MKLKFTIMFVLLTVSLVAIAAPTGAEDYPDFDPESFRPMVDAANLAVADFGITVGTIDFFTIGQGRSNLLIHQQDFKWVPNDPRRNAQGNDLTYLIDESDVATSSGVSAADAEGAFDRAMNTWNDLHATRKVDLVKVDDNGQDPDIYDFFLGIGDYGNPFIADIVFADVPLLQFSGLLAFSVTFFFVDPDGSLSDMNGDNYVDSALNEIYFNDAWGSPLAPAGSIWETFGWGIDTDFIDLETVALHESGHSLGLGHFNGPVAVMNAFYGGILHTPRPIDRAGMAIIFSSWPMD